MYTRVATQATDDDLKESVKREVKDQVISKKLQEEDESSKYLVQRDGPLEDLTSLVKKESDLQKDYKYTHPGTLKKMIL